MAGTNFTDDEGGPVVSGAIPRLCSDHFPVVIGPSPHWHRKQTTAMPTGTTLVSLYLSLLYLSILCLFLPPPPHHSRSSPRPLFPALCPLSLSLSRLSLSLLALSSLYISSLSLVSIPCLSFSLVLSCPSFSLFSSISHISLLHSLFLYLSCWCRSVSITSPSLVSRALDISE